jgi:hypothetical protein
MAPACVFREEVRIQKSVTLVGQAGSEIRGSDIWTGWSRSGAVWSRGGLPSFQGNGVCDPTSDGRCRWPQQVFYDGRPLRQVAANPRPGEFSVAGDRVTIADDPNGHTVEVTTRIRWIHGLADDVTIRGFTMRHSAIPAQQGALSVERRSRWTIENNVLTDAHGALLASIGGSNHRILNNEFARAGQVGIQLFEGDTVLVRGNRIHDNNTEGFFYDWDAGGLKGVRIVRLTMDANESYGNFGKGLWCDISCYYITWTNNRVHHNAAEGIFFEIGDGNGKVTGNAVWENGWHGNRDGINVSSTSNVEIWNNTVAWNSRGIMVTSNYRDRQLYNTYVHDNIVIMGGNSLPWTGTGGRTGTPSPGSNTATRMCSASFSTRVTTTVARTTACGNLRETVPIRVSSGAPHAQSRV